MKLDEFRKYLEIDKNNLDDEIVRQPALLFEVSEACAGAMAERDRFKEALNVVDASLDGEIRQELEGEKVTESIVKSLVQAHPKHDAAFDSYIEAKHTADVLLALKEAFHQRGYLIRDLAALFTANYYESSAVKDTQATDAAIYKRGRQRISEARQRRE